MSPQNHLATNSLTPRKSPRTSPSVKHRRYGKPAAAVSVVTGFMLLSACGTTGVERPDLPSPEALKSKQIEVESDKDALARSAQTPLYDLNLKRDEIPPALAALKVVYASSSAPGCAALIEEVEQLSSILGSDPAYTELQRHLAATEKAGDEAADTSTFTLSASDAVESTVSGFVPYSGIIRRLSGAEKHKRKLASIILRGQLRRAYLMGNLRNEKCPLPEHWNSEVNNQ